MGSSLGHISVGFIQEALAINADDLATLASRCQTVASANVCALLTCSRVTALATPSDCLTSSTTARTVSAGIHRMPSARANPNLAPATMLRLVMFRPSVKFCDGSQPPMTFVFHSERNGWPQFTQSGSASPSSICLRLPSAGRLRNTNPLSSGRRFSPENRLSSLHDLNGQICCRVFL